MDKLRPLFDETCQITFNGMVTSIPIDQEGAVIEKNFQIRGAAGYAKDIVEIQETTTGGSATFNNLTNRVTPTTLRYGLELAGFDPVAIEEIVKGNLTIEHLP